MRDRKQQALKEEPRTSPIPNEFHRWWRKHRHSGFVEDSSGHANWNTPPSHAWACTRYRAEFAACISEPYRPEVDGHPIEYAAEEYERWAQEQEEFEASGGNYPISREEFAKGIGGALAKMSAKFAERSKEAKGGRRSALTQAEVHKQINRLSRTKADPEETRGSDPQPNMAIASV